MSGEPLCAYCRQRPAESAWRPFCSERCKLADLGRWLGGHYRIPGAAAADELDEGTDDADEDPDATTPTGKR